MKKTNLLNAKDALEMHRKQDKANEAVKLHTKKEKISLVASNIAEVLDDEKAAKEAAGICAQNLKDLFVKMKNKDPLKDKIDLCKEPEWRSAIQELLKFAKDPDEKMKLFDYLRINLNDLWLEWSRSAYTYFSWNFSDAYYDVSFLKQDIIKETEIENRSEKCAENLINLYENFKLENENKSVMHMHTFSEWWKNIEDFLNWVSGRDIAKMFGHLSENLDDKWYRFSRPSYTYFENKNDGSAWISIEEKAHHVEKVA